jgi:hypothetical protein
MSINNRKHMVVMAINNKISRGRLQSCNFMGNIVKYCMYCGKKNEEVLDAHIIDET